MSVEVISNSTSFSAEVKQLPNESILITEISSIIGKQIRGCDIRLSITLRVLDCPNKSQRLRITVIDCSKKNAKKIPDKYLLPGIQNLLDRPNNSAVFSKIDLVKGIPGYKGHLQNLFEYLKIPCGLKN